MKDDATASQETDEERALQWYANAANIVAIPSTDVPLLGLFAREIFRLRKERDEANACAERWMAELNPAAGDSIPPDAPRAGGETPDIDLDATLKQVDTLADRLHGTVSVTARVMMADANIDWLIDALRAALLERHRDGEHEATTTCPRSALDYAKWCENQALDPSEWHRAVMFRELAAFLARSAERNWKPETIAALQRECDSMPDPDCVTECLTDAHQALASVAAPSSPENTNPLYYPLLFLVDAVEAEQRWLNDSSAGPSPERAPK